MIKSEFHWRRSRACTVTAVEQHQLGAEGLAHVLINIARDEGRKYRIAWKVEKRINPSQVHEIALSEYGRVMSVPEIVEEMRQHAMRDAAELQKYSDQLLADWHRDNLQTVKPWETATGSDLKERLQSSGCNVFFFQEKRHER